MHLFGVYQIVLQFELSNFKYPINFKVSCHANSVECSFLFKTQLNNQGSVECASQSNGIDVAD